MRSVKFYFDPVSPYVYFAFHQLPKLANKHNVTFNCVPVLFAGLLNEHGQKGPAEIEAKRKNLFVDCLRLSQLKNIPFNMPPAHPFNPLLASRMATAIDDPKQRYMFSFSVTEACWAKGKDITDQNLLINLAEQCGADGLALHQKAATEQVKKKLRDHTNQAIENGVFGVPSFYVKDTKELFWGSDRVDHLEAYLEGRLDLDYVKLQKILNHPRGAERKA
jgi:2-hydroxychromene-2-carboxylate isomerase